MTTSQIEIVFDRNVLADPNCDCCEGTGMVSDILEGDQLPCVCITEYRHE